MRRCQQVHRLLLNFASFSVTNMAFVTRTGKLSVNVSKYLRPVFSQRCISTSKKNEETATVTEKLPSHSAEHSEINNVAATVAKKKWMSHGYSTVDEHEDVASAHTFTFLGWSLCIIGGMLSYIYGPDRTLKDWAHREAYLLIREREAQGLPLIDPNYVDPSKMHLPSEEELGDFEIII